MKNAVTIDKYDQKILYELNKDGRIPVSKLAQKINKSKDFVNYRITRLKNLGIYVKDIVLMDTSKLGLSCYYLYLQVISKQKIPELIKYFRDCPEVWDIMKLIGKYQIFTVIYAKGIKQIEEIIVDLGEQFGDLIINYRLLSVYNGYSLAHNFLFKDFDNVYHHKLRFGANKVNLSEKELKLLAFLNNDGRASFNKIANEIGSNLPKVKEMYSDLIRREVIHSFRPSLNSVKLNYLHKHVLIRLKFAGMKKLNEIKTYLLGLKETKSLSLTFGRYDIVGRFIFESLVDFQEFQEDFYNKYGKFVYSLHADDYFEEMDYTPQQAMDNLIKEQELNSY